MNLYPDKSLANKVILTGDNYLGVPKVKAKSFSLNNLFSSKSFSSFKSNSCSSPKLSKFGIISNLSKPAFSSIPMKSSPLLSNVNDHDMTRPVNMNVKVFSLNDSLKSNFVDISSSKIATQGMSTLNVFNVDNDHGENCRSSKWKHNYSGEWYGSQKCMLRISLLNNIKMNHHDMGSILYQNQSKCHDKTDVYTDDGSLSLHNDFIELKSNRHFNNKEVQGKSTILSWIKIEGQAIRKGDTFAIIQNSNNGAIQYLTSPATGVVASIW